MSDGIESLDLSADKRADRMAYAIAVVFIALSWVILSNTDQIESKRAGRNVPWIEPWLIQGTSHIAIIITLLIIPFMLSRWPITLENWKRKIPIYLCGFFIFGTLHIALMDVLRTVSFPIILGRSYSENVLDIDHWIFELRKDAYTFLLVLSGFLTSRQMEQLRLEARHARHDARASGRITVKSGGRTIFLQADEIIWVEAASNYLEVHTETGQHLVRMTLGALENLLNEAGNMHVRIHRSFLVKRDAIREVKPTGDGRAVARLRNGQDLTVSRKYRAQFSD